MSKSTITAKGLSHKESKMESLTTPQYTAISEHSLMAGTPQAIREWLMSLQEASPVRIYPFVNRTQPEFMASEEDCGWAWPKRFTRLGPISLSWKTRQHSLLVG